MAENNRNIVIVGGGTAGWITACVLAADHRDAKVTLVESPDIPTIGVGEGTWPSMRMTMQRIGLPEKELLRLCDASFKQGTCFRGWGTGDIAETYYHPFSLPLEYASLNLADAWLQDDAGVPFATYVTPQASVIDAGLAPKQRATPDYAFNVNYGYHFDAGKFATLLKQHGVGQLGVNHILANVSRIHAGGDLIESVELDTGASVTGDLFVDCTGQRAMLIEGHYGVKLNPVNNILFNDTAIAVQVPYADPAARIHSTTHSTALGAGWVWDIGLQSRRGIGYVFSGKYLAETDAQQALMAYVDRISPGVDQGELVFRTIRFTPGYRPRQWVGNCVAVGLSAGFVEPLEASALAMIEQSAMAISDQLPATPAIMEVVASRFNDKMQYHWSRVVEFLKLHYALSRRDDSAYWVDNRDPESWPEELKQKLLLWSQQAPWHSDAPRVDELFPSASYQYVLYGMGFRPTHATGGQVGRKPTRDHLEAILQRNRQQAADLTRHLEGNRTLIEALTGH